MLEVNRLAKALPANFHVLARQWISRLSAPVVQRSEREVRGAQIAEFKRQMERILAYEAYGFNPPFDRPPTNAALLQNPAYAAKRYDSECITDYMKESVSMLDKQYQSNYQLIQSVSSEVDYMNEKAKLIDNKMDAIYKNDWEMIRELEQSVRACKTQSRNPRIADYSNFIQQEIQGLEESYRLVADLLYTQRSALNRLEDGERNKFVYNCERMVEEVYSGISVLRGQIMRQRQLIDGAIDAILGRESDWQEVPAVDPEQEFEGGE